MPSDPRTIRGPCFDCGEQCLTWCLADDPPQPESDDTAPTPKLDPETRPNVRAVAVCGLLRQEALRI